MTGGSTGALSGAKTARKPAVGNSNGIGAALSANSWRRWSGTEQLVRVIDEAVNGFDARAPSARRADGG